MDFPYHKDQLPSASSMFEKLVTYVKDPALSTKKLGGRIAMIYRSYPEDFNNSDSLSDHFTEPARMLATQGRKKSPMDTWHSWSSEYKNSMSREQLRDELYFKSGMANGFNPCIALGAFKLLAKSNQIRILDPCMGWGDRLIAALVFGATEYVGFDTNPDLVAPHEQIVDKFSLVTVVDAMYTPFELSPSDWYNPGGRFHEKFDFVLTSPPFWTVEIYNGDQTSTALYHSEHEWYVKFYNVLLDKSIKSLKPGAYLCLYISPQMYLHTKTFLLGYSRMEYTGAIGFYQTTGKKPIDERKVRDLFVWRKIL